MTVIAAGVLGLVVGSFLNVVIARMPLREPQDRSLRGRSRCLACDAPVRWHDNVPVVSFLVLRGRCRSCREPYGVRYLAVELLTGLLFAAVAGFGVLSGQGVLVVAIGCLFMAQLVAITFIDLRHRIIPNAITLPGTIVGIALWAIADPSRLLEVVLAAIGAYAVIFTIAFIKPQGMGMGDAKMVLLMGAFLGAPVAIAMFAGFLVGAIYGIGMMIAVGPRARKATVPFGPFLALGGVLGWFVGQPLLDAYLATFR